MQNILLVINSLQANELKLDKLCKCFSTRANSGLQSKIDLITRLNSKKRHLNQNNKSSTFRNKYSECL